MKLIARVGLEDEDEGDWRCCMGKVVEGSAGRCVEKLDFGNKLTVVQATAL